ncbi:ankyrin [Pilatotrama ljubarskyi]|nr:ankyrin [Pilatotrama ljubarskyi]
MQRLVDRPGYLSIRQGGQTLRDLYKRNSMTFHPGLLNEFALACYMGALDAVKQAVESGTAPDLSSQETAFKHGYAALVLFGAQRLVLKPGDSLDHIGTLKYLLEKGTPADVPDIVGYTALHHACMAYPRADMARILLEHGADPDWRDRFGSVALFGAFQNNSIDAIEVLMEFGARLDIPDADGHTPDSFFVKCGPRVTAVIQKWKRKRAGSANPLDEDSCAVCQKSEVQLKRCTRCLSTWYCSRDCQKSDWKSHKRTCKASDANSTITFKPYYSSEFVALISPADFARQMLGNPVQSPPSRNTRAVHVPNIPPGETKRMIIKVQVPFDMNTGAPATESTGDLMVYDKKRSVVCRIRKEDNPEGYTRLVRTVHTKGVAGAKAYFSAEMDSPEKLVVKVSEVLPEQAL